jgi:hypothetical protein
MIDALCAFATVLMGFAAHQTDRIVVMFPQDWELLSRYIIGTLTIFAAFVTLLRRIVYRSFPANIARHVMVIAIACYSIAASMVGCGVAIGRWLDDRKSSHD